MSWELLALVFSIACFLFAGIRVFSNVRRFDQADESIEIEFSENQDVGFLESQLALLNLGFKPWVFLIAGVTGALLIMLGFLEVFPNSFSMAVLSAVGGLLIYALILKDLATRAVKRFEVELSHSIDLMQASLRAGENPLGALTIAGEASKGAIQTEIKALVTRLELGMTIEHATARLETYYRTPSVKLFVKVLRVKWHQGGDLSELLATVSKINRERNRLQSKVLAQLAGARYASIFVAVLPYMVIPFFLWKNPVWLQTLTSHPLGPQLLTGAIMLQFIGLFWLRNILQVKLT